MTTPNNNSQDTPADSADGTAEQFAPSTEISRVEATASNEKNFTLIHGNGATNRISLEGSRAGQNFANSDHLRTWKYICLKAKASSAEGRFMLRIDKSGSDKNLRYIDLSRGHFNRFLSSDVTKVSGYKAVFPAGICQSMTFDVYGSNTD